MPRLAGEALGDVGVGDRQLRDPDRQRRPGRRRWVGAELVEARLRHIRPRGRVPLDHLASDPLIGREAVAGQRFGPLGEGPELGDDAVLRLAAGLLELRPRSGSRRSCGPTSGTSGAEAPGSRWQGRRRCRSRGISASSLGLSCMVDRPDRGYPRPGEPPVHPGRDVLRRPTLAPGSRRARLAGGRPPAGGDRGGGLAIVDRGTDFALSPAAPPTVEDEGAGVRYGSTAAVPSRLGEPSTGLGDGDPRGDRLAGRPRTRAQRPGLVVAGWDRHRRGRRRAIPRAGRDARRRGARAAVEVVRTTERLGQGAALNVGLRRSTGEVVVVLDTSVEPSGDIVTPLVRALDDPSVGVAGGWGISSDDLRRFSEAPPAT